MGIYMAYSLYNLNDENMAEYPNSLQNSFFPFKKEEEQQKISYINEEEILEEEILEEDNTYQNKLPLGDEVDLNFDSNINNENNTFYINASNEDTLVQKELDEDNNMFMSADEQEIINELNSLEPTFLVTPFNENPSNVLQNNSDYLNNSKKSNETFNNSLDKSTCNCEDTSQIEGFNNNVIENATNTRVSELWQHCGSMRGGRFRPASGGYKISLPAGEYKKNDLIKLGFKDNDLSAVKTNGLVVTLFDQDDFKGNSKTFTTDSSCFTNNKFVEYKRLDRANSWNDKTSSITVFDPKNAKQIAREHSGKPMNLNKRTQVAYGEKDR